MLYYPFTCENCRDNRLFDDKQEINYLIQQGYHQCGLCDHRTEIDPNLCYEDNKPEPIDYYCEKAPKYRGYDRQDFPSHYDMMVWNAHEDEELEDWQRNILSEFRFSDDLTDEGDHAWDDSLNQLKLHKYGWVKFAVWAFHFKLKRFYKSRYKTWKQFCEKVLHCSSYYVDKQIKAARVIKDLLSAGFQVLPQNEYQCRFLTKFWGDDLIDNWSMIVDAVPPHMITGDLLKQQFSVREEKEGKWVKINSQVWEEFAYKARSKGLDPNQVIEEQLQQWEDQESEIDTEDFDDDDIEDVPIEKVETWQNDLQALIEKKDSIDNWFTQLIFWSLAYDTA